MNEDIELICPVCGDELVKNGSCYSCGKRHSFDIARQGYVNLLPVQNKHSKMPGDAKDMLQYRRSFLDRGLYMPVCEDTAQMINKFSPRERPVLIDCGCGEGYYTAGLEKRCGAVCVGADISKEAAKMACARSRDILWIVATVSKLPVKSGSADVITAIFSLFSAAEYARVLRQGGIVVEVTAGSDHLIELKRLIYDEVFEQHKAPSPAGDEFELLAQEDRRFEITTDKQTLHELLYMTPHSRRMNSERREAFEKTDGMTVTVNYIIRVLRKL